MMDRNILEKKIAYLAELRYAIEAVPNHEVKANIGGRMQRVCDSIEADLNASKIEAELNKNDRTIIRNALNDRLTSVQQWHGSREDEEDYIERIERLILRFK